MDKSEFHYLNNKLYIHPFILWIQHLSPDDDESILQTFAHQIQKTYLNMSNNDNDYDDDDNQSYKEALGLEFLLPIEVDFFQEASSSDDSSTCSSNSDSVISNCVDVDELKEKNSTTAEKNDYNKEYERMKEKLELLNIIEPKEDKQCHDNEISNVHDDDDEHEDSQKQKNDQSLLMCEENITDDETKQKKFLIEEIVR